MVAAITQVIGNIAAEATGDEAQLADDSSTIRRVP
jgi:hypothetical protein